MSKESEDRENALFDDAQRAASASRCPSSEDQRTRNLKNSLMSEELNKRLEAEQRDRSDSSDSSSAYSRACIEALNRRAYEFRRAAENAAYENSRYF